MNNHSHHNSGTYVANLGGTLAMPPSKYRHINKLLTARTVAPSVLPVRFLRPIRQPKCRRRRARRRRRPRTAAGAAARRPRRASPGAAPSASTPPPRPPAGAPSRRRREPSRRTSSRRRFPAASAPRGAYPPSMTHPSLPPRVRVFPRGCRPSPSARRPPCLRLRPRPRLRRRWIGRGKCCV